jgi:predicted permease
VILARLHSIVRNLLRRDRVEQDLDDEVRAALDLLIDEHRRRGLSTTEARRAALLQLGGVESVKEQVREARAGAGLDTFLQDLRYAARLLVRNPLFTLTAALSVAIGVGATTTIFTVGNGLLLRSAVGVKDPGSLVDIVRVERSGGPGISPISYPDYLEIRRRTTTMQAVHAYQLMLEPSSLRVGEGGAERVFPTAVSTNFFQTLGIRPAAGRLFGEGDSEQAGTSPYVVLSHRFWDGRFNRDPSVVGQPITIDGHPFTILGVAAKGFRGTSVTAPDLWIPLGMIAATKPEDGALLMTGRQIGWLMVSARLKPGASRAQASAEVAAIGGALAREYPPPNQSAPPSMSMEGLVEKPFNGFVWSAETSSPIPYGLRIIAASFLALLLALVSTVLVIACANVAGVLLARATARRREIAVRVSSGAARGRLIRQLLTETTLLFLVGGLSGLALARTMTSLLVSLLPAFPVPIDLSVPLDYRVVSFSLSLSFVAALLAGLAPALHASKSDVVSALKDDVHGTPERLWLRHGFVVAQVAFSLLLVVTAGLFVRALGNVRSVDRGFDPNAVDAASIDLSNAGYTQATGAQFARELLERVRWLPGVASATLVDRAPGSGAMVMAVSVPGVTPPPGTNYFGLNWTIADTSYFRTLRIPIREGRDFTDSDSSGTEPVVILGRRAVERFWPGRSGVGQFIIAHTSGPGATKAPSVRMRVIGVVNDVSQSGPPEMYVPLQQRYWSTLTILVRRDPERSATGNLRDLVSSMDPNLPLLSAQALESLSSGPVETQLRLAATVAGTVGLVGLLLAAIGIYGITAYGVARRTREIGIRLSLGARRGNIVSMVLRQGMTLVATGLAIGLILSAAAGRLVMGRGFGPGVDVPPSDVPTFLGAAVLFALVGLLACYVPVRRAVRIQAMEALRYE